LNYGTTMRQSPGVTDTLGLDPVSLQKLYPVWQKQSMDAQTNGMPFPQFNEWVKMYRQGSMQNIAGDQP